MSLETSERLDNATKVLRTIGASEEADALEALRSAAASSALMLKQREREAMDAALQFERARELIARLLNPDGPPDHGAAARMLASAQFPAKTSEAKS